MKTFAVVNSADELRRKLVQYYQFRADYEVNSRLAMSLARDKTRSEIREALFRDIVRELLDLEIKTPAEMSEIQPIINASFL